MTFRWTISGLKIILEDGTTRVMSYGEISIYAVIAGICLGLIIGLIVSYVSKKRAQSIVKNLSLMKAVSEESALTLAELGEGKGISKGILKSGKPLRKYIACSNSENAEAEITSGFVKTLCRIFSREVPKRTDFEKARFYLPEEKRISAEVRYDTGKMTPVTVIISVILIIGLGIGAAYLVPKLLDMAKSVFGNS